MTKTGKQAVQEVPHMRWPLPSEGGPAQPGQGMPEKRRYQQEAVDALAEGLTHLPAGQLHAACGSGKSVISLRAVERLVPGEGLIVVLVPTIALVAQTLESWSSHAQVPFAALVVCGDETVTDAAVHAGDFDVPVSTDPATIASWAREPGRRLIVSTYVSALNVLAPTLTDARMEADMVVCDEAHHLTGKTDQPSKQLVDRAFLPARRRLYMTATPRANALTDTSGDLSMDDESVFGPVLYSYPFARAIAEGYLKDYRLAVVGVPDSEVRALLGDEEREYVEKLGGQDVKALVAQVALARAREMYGIRRAISFHPRVAAAQEFSRNLPRTLSRLPDELGTLSSHCVHGGMDSRQRKILLQDLQHPPKDGWTVISNSRCLSEGVDIPTVDAVLFAHPKRSAVDIVQAVGRALRPAASASGAATIVVPVPVPDSDGEIGDLDAGDYTTLWHVIRALRAHDEPLGLELDSNRLNWHTDNPQLPSKITMVMPESISQQVLQQLTLLLVRQTTSPWWEGLAAARTYYTQHGDLNVPSQHVTTDGYRLGQWISMQRKYHSHGWLRSEQASQLEDIGMTWNAFDARFERGLAAARAFHAQHGHLNVPQRHCEDGFKLGTWLSNQRQNYRQETLPEHRVRALEELGMFWRGKGPVARLGSARAYHAEHGHLAPPADTVYRGFNLSQWLGKCRAEHRTGALDPQLADALEALGIIWNPHGDRWEQGLEAVRAFHAEHGHLRVPKDYPREKHGLNLPLWLQNKRTDYRQGRLPEHRIEALEQLGMVWEPHTDSWRRGLAAAQDYAAQHGHLRPPKDTWHNSVQLSAWLTKARRDNREERLEQERIEALTAIGMEWSVRRGAGPAADRRRGRS